VNKRKQALQVLSACYWNWYYPTPVKNNLNYAQPAFILSVCFSV